jgi:anti-sigma factor RsiW
MDPDLTHGLNDAELADLARLVDGTLPRDRRADVEARVAGSPQLTSIVERQRVAVDAMRGIADTGAPARLRGNVERRHRARRAVRAQSRRTLPAAAVAGAAALAVAVVLAVSGTFSGGPSAAELAALSAKGATAAPPAAAAGAPQLLRVRVDDVPFPDYAKKFGWTAAGLRNDKPSGRNATTVYYENNRRSIAYTIVAGSAIDPPSNARRVTRGGVEYRTLSAGGRSVVTWNRRGHTCVLSSRSVTRAELLALADWRGKGAIPF